MTAELTPTFTDAGSLTAYLNALAAAEPEVPRAVSVTGDLAARLAGAVATGPLPAGVYGVTLTVTTTPGCCLGLLHRAGEAESPGEVP